MRHRCLSGVTRFTVIAVGSLDNRLGVGCRLCCTAFATHTEEAL